MLKTIVTHSGKFHADESLAVALLQRLPQFKGAKVVRTRDPALIAAGDVVVDVGGVYDPSTLRFDHHQHTFKDALCKEPPFNRIRLSSAGLVYKHYGHDVISSFLMSQGIDSQSTVSLVYDKLYERFVETFDAVDNGVDRVDPACIDQAKVAEGRSLFVYHKGYDIFDMVSDLNPDWNDDELEWQAADARFLQAVALVDAAFERQLRYLTCSWLPARSVVSHAVQRALAVDLVPRYIVLEESSCPWKEHLFDLEREHNLGGHFLFVIYPESRLTAENATTTKWRLQGVPPMPEGTFDLRVPIVRDWWGLRDEELSMRASMPDCVFVHASGFIGGHRTRDGVIAMAEASIRAANK